MFTTTEITTPTPAPKYCSQCEILSTTLKNCAKCKSVSYCNRTCQTAHWLFHKKDCARLAGNPAAAAGTRPEASTFTPPNPDDKPFTAISNNKFLHNRPKETVFKLLIDCLRLR